MLSIAIAFRQIFCDVQRAARDVILEMLAREVLNDDKPSKRSYSVLRSARTMTNRDAGAARECELWQSGWGVMLVDVRLALGWHRFF